MDGCNEFRKPETYKNNPLEQSFKILNFEENLLIWQPEFKKSTLTAYFLEFWMIKRYGVTVDENELKRTN